MSAKFIWVRNPTAINGLATTYVSLRGSDTTGDGTAQNPYRSLAKATTVAAANTNIMVDDGNWKEAHNYKENQRWWGNANTRIYFNTTFKGNQFFYNLDIRYIYYNKNTTLIRTAYLYNCRVYIIDGNFGNNGCYIPIYMINNSIVLKIRPFFADWVYSKFTNSIIIYCLTYNTFPVIAKECILGASNNYSLKSSTNNNFTTKAIPSSSPNSINNASCGQSYSNYFNNVASAVFSNPTNVSEATFFSCDFTAKAGSANIGAGVGGATIGLNEGIPSCATNDSNDIFCPTNGATLVNVAWNSSLNGYSLVHKDKVCAGSTASTITLAADAEPTDDYYNGLFIGITAGSGYGEIHRITDYDGTTKVATIDGNWTTQPDTESIYSITGTIVSATKDYGKVIRIKQNWTFCGNMQSWSDTNDSSYGMWKEFITTPLLNNGVWELRPCSNFRYEYSLNGTDWYSNAELITGTDTDNKTDGDQYGNASENFVPAVARATRLRYARFHIEIGFNIGEDA